MKPAAHREHFADELRGFALLGIVVVNVPFLGLSTAGFTDASLASTLDRVVAFGVIAFAQAKFYLLFAFLFGYSLSFLLGTGTSEQFRIFRRRLFGLGAIGLAHAWLFFIGDILLVYAVLGLVLLWLTNKSDRVVLWVAVAAAIAWLVWLTAIVALVGGAPSADAIAQTEVRAADATLRTGTFFEALGVRVSLWPVALAFILALNGLAIVGMFCVGLVAGRRKLLAEPATHRGLWRRGLAIAALIGLPGALASAWLVVGPGVSPEVMGTRQLLGTVIGFATAPALTLGYVAVLALARERFDGVLRIFRPAGRMSLTGYVGESVILATVFCGFGLGLLGQVGAATAVAIALCAWVLLDAFAHLWQRRFRYGPLEYLLRWWSHANRPATAGGVATASRGDAERAGD